MGDAKKGNNKTGRAKVVATKRRASEQPSLRLGDIIFSEL